MKYEIMFTVPGEEESRTEIVEADNRQDAFKLLDLKYRVGVAVTNVLKIGK